jgi:hypothetical protein
MHFPSLPYITCSTHLNLLHLIILIVYMLKHTSYEAPHCAISSAPRSQTPSTYVLSFVRETKFYTHTKHKVKL